MTDVDASVGDLIGVDDQGEDESGEASGDGGACDRNAGLETSCDFGRSLISVADLKKYAGKYAVILGIPLS